MVISTKVNSTKVHSMDKEVRNSQVLPFSISDDFLPIFFVVYTFSTGEKIEGRFVNGAPPDE